MFNSKRLSLARRRRGFTKKGLADKVGVTARALTAYEGNEYPPADDVVDRLATALNFPKEFFFGDDLEEPDQECISFRSLKRMTAAQRDSALAAGALALELSRWVEGKFQLPPVDMPNLSGEEPETAAAILRQEWGLGELSIRNMVHLLEAKGVRVFSLSEHAREVDAFSHWRGAVPFIFLNTCKSNARSRFDAAHELGHIVMHKQGIPTWRDAEREADKFASAFLMPNATVTAVARRTVTLDHLVELKKRWLVSVAALARRLRDLGLISEWHYRTLCVQISERGWRTDEPEDAPRETSRVWEKVLGILRQEGMSKSQIARELCIPDSEIERLVWGLVTIGLSTPDGSSPIFVSPRRGNLRAVTKS